MSNIVNNFTTGQIKISEEYNLDSLPSAIDATPYFSAIGQEWAVSFIQLERVKKFTQFEIQTIGTLQTRYLEVSYRVSRNGSSWTNFFLFDESSSTQITGSYSITKTQYTLPDFPPFDPLESSVVPRRWTVCVYQ